MTSSPLRHQALLQRIGSSTCPEGTPLVAEMVERAWAGEALAINALAQLPTAVGEAMLPMLEQTKTNAANQAKLDESDSREALGQREAVLAEAEGHAAEQQQALKAASTNLEMAREQLRLAQLKVDRATEEKAKVEQEWAGAHQAVPELTYAKEEAAVVHGRRLKAKDEAAAALAEEEEACGSVKEATSSLCALTDAPSAARSLCASFSSATGSIRVQLAALQAATDSAGASTAAALALVHAGALEVVEDTSARFGSLVEAQKVAAVQTLMQQACKGVEEQLQACGDTDDMIKEVLGVRDEVEAAETVVRTLPSGSEEQEQHQQAIAKRDGLRTRLHEALPPLRELQEKRWGVLECCPASLGEAVMTLKNKEGLWMHEFEAIETLSDKKQQQQHEIQKLLQSIASLTTQKHDWDIRLRKAELQELQSGGGASPQQASGAIVCSVCEEDAATLTCGDCDGKLYCDACSAFIHSKASKKSHTPTAIDSSAAAIEQQSSEHYKQQLAVSKRQLEKEQQRLSKLTLPHFPEHSGWGEGLDKLASSNLVVQRKLADDYEELGELGVGGGVGGGGQGVVLKVKLLGEEDGDGAIKVLKQLPRTDMKTLLSEALVPHMLQVTLAATPHRAWRCISSTLY